MRKELNISRNEIWISRNLRFNYVTHTAREIEYSILAFPNIWTSFGSIKNAKKFNENEMRLIPDDYVNFNKYGERFTMSTGDSDLLCKVEVPEIMRQNIFVVQKTMITSLFNIVYFNQYSDEIEIGTNTSIYPTRKIFKKIDTNERISNKNLYAVIISDEEIVFNRKYDQYDYENIIKKINLKRKILVNRIGGTKICK